MKYSNDSNTDFSRRIPEGLEDKLFLERWSPRSFKKEEIPTEDLSTIFGAARWTQSCFNEQPWLFITESGEGDREIFENLLLPQNASWAKSASLIGFIFSKNNFQHNNKPNRWAGFDTGAAWMAMALQARFLGLYTHGMAGIKKDEVYIKLNVSPEEYQIQCGFVIGVQDKPEKLGEELRSREFPSGRKALAEIWKKGVLPWNG
ncbi:MAG: nitroreductase family protein [Spirochaetales bacterium]|nr:nitroreductase family protein [Spirochaetales bacterium]